jgi:hypothetical protein
MRDIAEVMATNNRGHIIKSRQIINLIAGTYLVLVPLASTGSFPLKTNKTHLRPNTAYLIFCNTVVKNRHYISS